MENDMVGFEVTSEGLLRPIHKEHAVPIRSHAAPMQCR